MSQRMMVNSPFKSHSGSRLQVHKSEQLNSCQDWHNTQTGMTTGSLQKQSVQHYIWTWFSDKFSLSLSFNWLLLFLSLSVSFFLSVCQWDFVSLSVFFLSPCHLSVFFLSLVSVFSLSLSVRFFVLSLSVVFVFSLLGLLFLSLSVGFFLPRCQ